VAVTVLFLWGALSDERTSLSFVYAPDPCQGILSRFRVPWDSRPYFTLSELRLPFSSPPTTRRVTVEVFEPVSTPVYLEASQNKSQHHIATDGRSVSQSVSQSWCRAQSGAYDQIFITVSQLWSCYCGAPSLTRGWVCILSQSLSAVVSHLSQCKGYLRFT
jgi:hypothetical protein